MATKIEWTEETWNPVVGCKKISAGCKNCYAEVMAKRLQKMGTRGYENGWLNQINYIESELTKPLKRKKPTMYFVGSMTDLFQDGVSWEYLDRIFEVINQCPQHIFQILTKRSENMFRYFLTQEIPCNVWLGVTVENKAAISRIDDLAGVMKASVRFLSCEPLLEDLGELDLTGVDWVIVGGESGKNARPMNPEWARSIRNQCIEAEVPFFFKQWGEWVAKNQSSIDGIVTTKTPAFATRIKGGDLLFKAGKKNAGNLLDGQAWQQMPEVKNA